MFQRADLSALSDTGAAIYQQFAPEILAYIRRRTVTLQDAEDILVETFLVALQSASFLQLTGEQQSTWLRRVAQNKITDQYRRTHRQPSVAFDEIVEGLVADEMDLPEASALRNEEQQALRAAIQLLAPLEQTVLRLRFAEGMRSPQIAQTLGKSEEAVRKLLSRTLNKLRAIYTDR
jgi:RNA polymerase sigma factor (sigma-70 family)